VRPPLASIGAIVAGVAVTALTATLMDMAMHAAGVFPHAPQAMSDPLFVLAAAYRAVFTVAGGYATARLAPDRPMRHAWILAGIGLVAGLAGVAAYYAAGGGRLGPAWYALAIPLEAVPCVWLGARLAAVRSAPTKKPSPSPERALQRH
jgi:peptidoglycan/LPS O-acetylase OafA/YrhL